MSTLVCLWPRKPGCQRTFTSSRWRSPSSSTQVVQSVLAGLSPMNGEKDLWRGILVLLVPRQEEAKLPFVEPTKTVTGPVAAPVRYGLKGAITPAKVWRMAGTTGLHTLKLDCGRSEEHTSELQSRQYLVCR